VGTDRAAPATADFSVELPVRWADCDPARVVFYPNYFAYFEDALRAFVEHRGTSWTRLMEGQGLFFPRVEAQARYLAPASYDDRIRVSLRVQEVTRKILTMGWVMRRCHDERVVAEGHVKFAVIRPEPGATGDPRAIEVPPEVAAIFGGGESATGRGQ